MDSSLRAGGASHPSPAASDSFVAFPKIARYSREVIVTEKIDGTNAQVAIVPVEELPYGISHAVAVVEGHAIFAGSRSRWLSITDDNFNFARWVQDNAPALAKLGPGRHYGEWWGSGIQRGYGLPKGEKRFSLFNVSRWADDAVRPSCCHVVPMIGRYVAMEFLDVRDVMNTLLHGGSYASPGFMKPEGVVIFHVHGNFLFKKTFEKDEGKERGA